MRLPDRWGATDAEHATAYDADRLAADWTAPRRLTRAVGVRAPTPLVYRWLCQLAVAPYSYDLLDNRGRRSPRTLTPGADDLTLGQPMITGFTLAAVRPGESLTLAITPWGRRAFGLLLMTYAVAPGPDGSRLLCRIVVDTPTALSRARAEALAWGDLIMMRKQLHTLRDLAERDAQRDAQRDAERDESR